MRAFVEGGLGGDTVADLRIPHKGDVVGQVIEGAYDVLDGFLGKQLVPCFKSSLVGMVLPRPRRYKTRYIRQHGTRATKKAS